MWQCSINRVSLLRLQEIATISNILRQLQLIWYIQCYGESANIRQISRDIQGWPALTWLKDNNTRLMLSEIAVLRRTMNNWLRYGETSR